MKTHTRDGTWGHFLCILMRSAGVCSPELNPGPSSPGWRRGSSPYRLQWLCKGENKWACNLIEATRGAARTVRMKNSFSVSWGGGGLFSPVRDVQSRAGSQNVCKPRQCSGHPWATLHTHMEHLLWTRDICRRYQCQCLQQPSGVYGGGGGAVFLPLFYR